jgi:hypothetical protein
MQKKNSVAKLAIFCVYHLFTPTEHTNRYKNYVLNNDFFEDDTLNAEFSFQDVKTRIILNSVRVALNFLVISCRIVNQTVNICNHILVTKVSN